MGKRLKLGEMLVAKGLISEAQLANALGEQRRWGKRLGMTLVLMGFLEEEVLIRTLAAQLKLPVARIRGKRVNAEVVELVPVELAEKHRCLPLFVKSQDGARELFLAMEDPSDLDAQGELGFRIGFRIRPVLVAPTELEDALQRHYHWASLVGQPSEESPAFAPLAARDGPPARGACAARAGALTSQHGRWSRAGSPEPGTSRSRTPSPSCAAPGSRRRRPPPRPRATPSRIPRHRARRGRARRLRRARAHARAAARRRAASPRDERRRAAPRPRCRRT